MNAEYKKKGEKKLEYLSLETGADELIVPLPMERLLIDFQSELVSDDWRIAINRGWWIVV